VTPGQARQRIRPGEGQRTEFKESFGLEREIVQALAAFANSRGGLVLVGVRNDKSIVGVTIGANTLENFANNVRRNTSPPLLPEIDEIKLEGKTVVAVSVEPIGPGEVVYAYNVALRRVGRTNQPMPSALQRKRMFADFRAENPKSGTAVRAPAGSESWADRESRREDHYIRSRGLFLVHSWQPSEDEGQIADVVIRLQQHPGSDQPLSDGKIKAVEYHLGPKFFDRTVVKTDPRDGFKLEISAYGPVLCLAMVHFDDGTPSLELQRYIDFQ
jgi:hypothetical protein